MSARPRKKITIYLEDDLARALDIDARLRGLPVTRAAADAMRRIYLDEKDDAVADTLAQIGKANDAGACGIFFDRGDRHVCPHRTARRRRDAVYVGCPVAAKDCGRPCRCRHGDSTDRDRSGELVLSDGYHH